ncbi:MAG: SDR family oxidoreductase [Patescibacteria group bacterium]
MGNKTALITGGSRGIGLAIARGLANDGYEVILVARKQEELNDVQKSMPSRAQTFAVDVTDAEAVAGMCRTIPALDILVNAAGVIEPIGSIENVDPEQWLQLLKINVFGTFLMTHACVPLLAKRGGTIINFVGGGEGAFPNFSAYAASKGAIARFTETAAVELKTKNITVNAIAPGPVNTKMTDNMIAAGEDAGAQYERALKQKESAAATPEKVVRLALWLCSDASRGITGKIISAQWDDYEKFPEHRKEISSTDVYTMRRVRPKDRGLSWE